MIDDYLFGVYGADELGRSGKIGIARGIGFIGAEDLGNLDLLVFPNIDDVLALAGGDHSVANEFTHDLDWWVGNLFLDQLVAIFSYGGLDRLAIHSLLLELFAKLEFDSRALECRCSRNHIGSIRFYADFDGWRSGSGDLAGNEANIYFLAEIFKKDIVRDWSSLIDCD